MSAEVCPKCNLVYCECEPCPGCGSRYCNGCARPAPLVWTREAPKEPGWYRFRVRRNEFLTETGFMNVVCCVGQVVEGAAMSHPGHERVECMGCGVVIRQCRCPNTKPVRRDMCGDCRHKPPATLNATPPAPPQPLTLEALRGELRAMEERITARDDSLSVKVRDAEEYALRMANARDVAEARLAAAMEVVEAARRVRRDMPANEESWTASEDALALALAYLDAGGKP